MPELKYRAYWLEKAKTLRIEGRAFIDGVYVDAHMSATFWSYSPIDALPLAPVALCASADVARAVAAARRSFEVGVWSGLAPRERKAVLLKWAALLEAHTDYWRCWSPLTAANPSQTPPVVIFLARFIAFAGLLN